MVRTAKPRSIKPSTSNVCRLNPRFTLNKSGRIVSAKASHAAKAKTKNNDALKKWRMATKQAAAQTGVTLKPTNLKKGSKLYTAARKIYDS